MLARTLLVVLALVLVGVSARDPLLDDLPGLAALESAVGSDAGPMEDTSSPTLRFEEAPVVVTQPKKKTANKTVVAEVKKNATPSKDSKTTHHGKKFVCAKRFGSLCTHYVRCATWTSTTIKGKTTELCVKKFTDKSKLTRKVCTHFSKTSYENVDTFTCTRWKVCRSWTLTKGGHVKCTKWTGKFINDKTFCVKQQTRQIAGKAQKYCKYARICKVTKKVELKQGVNHVKPATHECLVWRGPKYLAGNHAYWARLHRYKRLYRHYKRQAILDGSKLRVKARRATRRKFLWRKYYKLYRSFKKKFYRAVMNASSRKAQKSRRASYLKGALSGKLTKRERSTMKRCGVSRRIYAASRHMCHTAKCRRRALQRYVKHCKKWRKALSQKSRSSFRKCMTARTVYRAKVHTTCTSTAADFAECKRKLRWTMTRKQCKSWRAIQRYRRRQRAYRQCKKGKNAFLTAIALCKKATDKKTCVDKAQKTKVFECFPHKFFRTAALFYRNGRKQRRACVAATHNVPAAIAKCKGNMECVGKAATAAKNACTPFHNFVSARKAFRVKYALVFKHRRCIVAGRVFKIRNTKCGKNYACKAQWRTWKRAQCAPWNKAQAAIKK